MKEETVFDKETIFYRRINTSPGENLVFQKKLFSWQYLKGNSYG